MILPNFPNLSGFYENFKQSGPFLVKDQTVINGKVITNAGRTVVIFLKEGLLHSPNSESGALIDLNDHRIEYYQHGKLHRLNRPAIIRTKEEISQYSDETYQERPNATVLYEEWRENGLLHRLDGAAQPNFPFEYESRYCVRGEGLISYEAFVKHPEVIAYRNKENLKCNIKKEFGS